MTKKSKAVAREEHAKAVHEAVDLSDFSYDDLRRADAWIREYACNDFRKKVKDIPEPYREYLLLMVRSVHYGSLETDQLLTDLKCYPSWMYSALED